MTPDLKLVRPAPEVLDVDAAALREVAAGNVGALGEVYDRHAATLLTFIRHLCPRDDAEDLVQVVFVRVVSIARSYKPGGPSAKPWLFGIAVRVVQERRRTLRQVARLAAELASWPRRSAAQPDLERGDILRALDALSEPKRIVLVLTEIEGFTAEEIATLLCIPVGTVWTRLHHARREVRRHLEETR